MRLSDIEKSHKEDFDDMESWLDETYHKVFASYFEDQRNIGKRIDNSDTPITNEELEHIMIDVPISLIDVSEVVNSYRLRIESMKLEIKSKSLQTEDAFSGIQQVILEDKLLIAAYESLIHRVEKEISYSRELIMGAKKVWDSRQNTLNSMPISPNSVPEQVDPLEGLPEYSSRRSNQYIR